MRLGLSEREAGGPEESLVGKSYFGLSGDESMTVWLFLWILLLVDAAVEIGWMVWGERERLRHKEELTQTMKKDFTSTVNYGIGDE